MLIAALSPIYHYAAAFKIVTILGTVLMPLAAYLFGRLAGFARPVPAVMAAAMVAFLFNTSYTIDGGNIASTLAGEFSFTLGVALGLIFLGTLSFSLRTETAALARGAAASQLPRHGQASRAGAVLEGARRSSSPCFNGRHGSACASWSPPGWWQG